jgi:LDH2 family malate/lactate/ureidoglycolate dehydrogenase
MRRFTSINGIHYLDEDSFSIYGIGRILCRSINLPLIPSQGSGGGCLTPQYAICLVCRLTTIGLLALILRSKSRNSNSQTQFIIPDQMASKSETETPQALHYIKSADLDKFAQDLLVGNGVSQEHSSIIATCLVQADLRGVDTHGTNRLPSYIKRIQQGVLNPRAIPLLTQTTPVVAHIDGNNAFGFLSAHMGMAAAIQAAQTYGIGMTSVSHSNHFGMSAWLVQQAIDANMMALVFTNSSSALPAWGSREKLLGTSPIACGAPAGKERAFILDMAPSIAARGKIYKAARRGEKIPLDWALDKDGRRTDDPNAALLGTLLPMGGPKGSGLAIMMDVFSGVLSGSAFAGGVTNPYDPSREANVGHFLVAVKPDLFMGLEEFKERMDFLYRRVVGAEKKEERLRTGIPFVDAEVQALNDEADRVGVKRLVVIDHRCVLTSVEEKLYA